MSIEPAGHHPTDRFPYYFSGAMTALRYLFWLGALLILLPGLEPLLEHIAGRETIFRFDAVLNVSIVLNIAGVAALVTALRRNRKLNERVRDLEGRRPPQRLQQETLPLPEDGARA